MKQLLVATTNRGKLAELGPRLAEFGFEVVGLDDVGPLPEAVEDGDTFAANARRKAEHYARLAQLPTLADDSGLEVEALEGRPGVRSARYAGEHATDAENNALLLSELAGVTDRAARFVCALCLVDEAGSVLEEVDGTCPGSLLEAGRGEHGFGYDPLFVPHEPDTDDPRTFAERTRDEKRALSHRGHALAALFERLAARGTEPA